MAYKVFVAGEEALASDANSYLMSQTVARFTNAAQRTSQLTAPVLNQLSVLDTAKGVPDFWDGAAWRPLPVGYQKDNYVTFGGGVFSGTPQTISMLTFTMPFTGIILVTGVVRWDPLAGQPATIMNTLTEVASTSVPPPALKPQSVGPAAAANACYSTQPFWGRINGVSAGTAVDVKVTVSCNAAGASLTFLQVSARVIPGEIP